MAFRSTLELYSSLILPRLAEGLKTLEQLDVPQCAVECLQAHGLAKPRMYRVGAVAIQMWFRPGDLALLDEVQLQPWRCGKRGFSTAWAMTSRLLWLR